MSAEPAEIKERKQQQTNQAMTGITQAWQMINKTIKLFIDAKVKNGITEDEAMQMVHSAMVHELANCMAYGFHKKYIPDLQVAINNTVSTLAGSVIEILEAHTPKNDKKIILPGEG